MVVQCTWSHTPETCTHEQCYDKYTAQGSEILFLLRTRPSEDKKWHPTKLQTVQTCSTEHGSAIRVEPHSGHMHAQEVLRQIHN
mmetsp:Transcript_24027/g.37779  ORF Transcript_24027/g.37779 Transcript_24027/m.37779 type:complete len:84 (+) Transcript_24027:88-339(+)